MIDDELSYRLKLTQGMFAVVDKEDFIKYSVGNSWYAGGLAKPYVSRDRTVNGKRVREKLHRLIMNAKKGQVVDHINGDTLDNRKANLRLCTQVGNMANARLRKDNKTGYKGVHKHNRGTNYEASIMYRQKPIYISRFETPEEAAMAYDNAAIALFGEFAKTNGETVW